MVRYARGLRPAKNFKMDPNRTILEQIKELPYDMRFEFLRKDITFVVVIGEGNFGRIWHAKAKEILNVLFYSTTWSLDNSNSTNVFFNFFHQFVWLSNLTIYYVVYSFICFSSRLKKHVQ